MGKSILTENEKMTNQVLGDNNAQTFFMNGQSGKDYLHQEAVNKFNDAVDREAARQEEYFTDINKYAQEVNENIKNIEIMPISNYVLVKPFKENPFQRIVKTESGLILDTGGLRPEFKNTDTGEIQEEEQFIFTGVVQEVGPDCRFIHKGDVVMYPKSREVPVPFYKQGLVVINETGIIVTINEGLTERFDEYKRNSK